MTHTAVVDQTTMTTRDGTQLATEMWLPGSPEPRPALLVRTPYNTAASRYAHDPLGMIQSGFAVVFQDVRGRWRSQGDFDPYQQEVRDGRDTIQWVSKQPWCDGNVVTTGGSYLGATQWLAASTSPRALRAISPIVSAPSYHDGWTFENGSFQQGFVTQWCLDIAATTPGRPPDQLRRVAELRSDLVALARKRPQDNGVAEVFPPYRNFGNYRDSAFWRPIDVTRKFGRLDVAGYHLGGWYDLFCEGTIAGYQGMRSSAASDYARRSQRLVIGPWSHVGVYLTTAGSWDFGPEANGFAKGFPQEITELLKGSLDRREVPTGVSVFVMGANRWAHLPDWPPRNRSMELFLDAREGARSAAGDGRLTRRAPEASGSDRWTHDPDDPVPNRGGRTLGEATPVVGPCDQRDIEARSDVLVYTGDPLKAEQWLLGEVTADLWFSTTAAEADVVVKLVDVHPDGRAVNIVDGVRRVPGSPRPRKVSFTVGNTAYRFLPGHRIRIDIAGANFPRIALAPGGEQAVHRGGRTLSRVTLPAVRPLPA